MHITVKTTVDPREIWVGGHKIGIKDSQLVVDHSNELSWGFLGSGPAQTALACCVHLFGPYVGVEVYHQFKCNHVAHWTRFHDGERSVDLEKFYFDHIEGRASDLALSRFSQNVYNRLFAAVEDDEIITGILDESAVVNSDGQTRIITKEYSRRLEQICEAFEFAYVNLDGRWQIIASMPTTGYLRQLQATAKKCLQV